MNPYFIVGIVVTLFGVIAAIFVSRYLKRVARRCSKWIIENPSGIETKRPCGRLDVKRHFKILLLSGEAVSWRGSEGRLRFFIREVVKLTFSECPVHGHELVKVDRSPISVWHAYIVKWLHPDQYDIEEQTLFAVERSMPQLLGRKWKQDPALERCSDPPLSVYELVDDVLASLSESLEDIFKP